MVPFNWPGRPDRVLPSTIQYYGSQSMGPQSGAFNRLKGLNIKGHMLEHRLNTLIPAEPPMRQRRTHVQ